MIEIEESARKRPNKDNNSSSNETFNESTSKNETTPENDNSTNSEDSNSTNVNKKVIFFINFLFHSHKNFSIAKEKSDNALYSAQNRKKI